MRLLTRCYACHRQYDVSHRPPKSQFRCRCTKVLTVPDVEAQSHDAAVVRCSGCGGPRHGQEESCNYCGATFTLLEKDLHVICPTCFTRISAHAKFCHSCATPIVIEQELGKESKLACPVCDGGPKLVSRSLGPSQTAVLECPSCAGIWISHGLFERAVRHNQEQAVPPAAAGVRGDSSKVHQVKMRRQQGPMYRKCPECQNIMNRQNYARRSGIIIDICAQHGIWFDAQELEAILEWLRRGGDGDRDSSYVPERASVRVTDDEAREAVARATVNGPTTLGSRRSGAGFDVAEVVTDLLFQLFR